MVGPTQETITLGNMYTSAHPKWGKKFKDTLHNEFTTYARLREGAEQSVARRKEFTIKYQGFSNVTSNGFDSGAVSTPEYPNIFQGGSVAWGTYELFPQITNDAMKLASSAKAKFNLVDGLLDEAVQSLKQEINDSIWRTTQGANKFTSLYVALPTSLTGSLHGISRTQFSAFCHQLQDCGGLPFSEAFYNNYRQLYNAQLLGMKSEYKPTDLWSSLTLWNLWEQQADKKDLVLMTKDGASGTKTTEAFQIRNAKWQYDRSLTATDRVFSLCMHKEAIEYEYFSETLPGAPVKAGNGRFHTQEVSIVGQLSVTIPRLQGVCYNFTPA